MLPRRFQTWLLAGTALAVLAVSPGCAFNQKRSGNRDYPSRPIKLVVPFAAGGGTDTFARIIKKAVEDNRLLPAPLVIINRDGAGATIGSRFVKDADPDGYTMMILHDAILTARYSGTVEYGPEAFEPIAGTGQVGMVITVDESSPFRDLRQLVERARDHPNTVTFGVNMGALTHFAGLHLENCLPGAQFRFVQIGGGAHRFSDLKGGHIDVTGFSIEEFLRFREDGLRGLAYYGEERHPAAPRTPTAREQGFDVTMSNTFYWWFPKGVARERVDRIAEALQAAMQTEYVQAKMADIHCEPVFLRGRRLHQRIEASAARIAGIDLRETTGLPDFPAIVAGIVAGLLGLIGVGGWKERRSAARSDPESLDSRDAGRTGLAAVCFLLTVIYVAVMAAGWLRFGWATTLFTSAVTLLLARRPLRWSPGIVAGAAALGFGVQYLFTHVLTIDLP